LNENIKEKEMPALVVSVLTLILGVIWLIVYPFAIRVRKKWLAGIIAEQTTFLKTLARFEKTLRWGK
jgi:hypothetical protein